MIKKLFFLACFLTISNASLAADEGILQVESEDIDPSNSSFLERECALSAARPSIINALFKFKVGVVFSMNFIDEDEGDWTTMEDGLMLPPMPRLTRAVSTYGKTGVNPSEWHKYRVTEIGKSIPNLKGWRMFDDSYKPNKRKMVLMLEKQEQTDSEYIFWYINAENGWIESFEDGHYMGTITGIERDRAPKIVLLNNQ